MGGKGDYIAFMLSIACVVLVLAATPEKQDQPEPFDISANKANLRIITDGKGHYYAWDFKGGISGPAFYGDGKVFYVQRIASGGGVGDTEVSHGLWDPRISWATHGPPTMQMKNDTYTITCHPKEVAFTKLGDAEAKAMIDAATWLQARWNRRPYKLARDEKGVYYFVDHQREAKRDFHLWVGPRGAMKAQKMTNIVSDSVGDIFATKSGELRLVLNDNKHSVDGAKDNKVLKWVSGKTETLLTEVPIEDNAALIYNELGPYVGERLGTPCDDI